MIAVCIVTYNQESFIGKAIESVLTQECDESLRIYIGNDASTDDTDAICSRYAAQDKRITYVRHESNHGLVKNTIDLYMRILADGADYIAMLDGDDYWTDTHKLQKEIDYLRQHTEYGFIHTAAQEAHGEQIINSTMCNPPVGDLRHRYNLLGARHTNCTVLFRANLLNKNELKEIQSLSFPVLDYPLYGLFSTRTLFAYLDFTTAVWTNHTSVSSPITWKTYIRYKKERLRMWRWLAKKEPKYFKFSPFSAIIWYVKQVIGFFL